MTIFAKAMEIPSWKLLDSNPPTNSFHIKFHYQIRLADCNQFYRSNGFNLIHLFEKYTNFSPVIINNT